MNIRTFITFYVFVVLSGCSVWQLGEDPNGKQLREEANLVVAALVKCKNENGEYPSSLDELSPKYLPELPEIVDKIFYSKEKETINYHYSPSWPQGGQTSCSTVIGSRQWGCHGYF